MLYADLEPAVAADLAALARPYAVQVVALPAPLLAWAERAFDGRRAGRITVRCRVRVYPSVRSKRVEGEGVQWSVREAPIVRS